MGTLLTTVLSFKTAAYVMSEWIVLYTSAMFVKVKGSKRERMECESVVLGYPKKWSARGKERVCVGGIRILIM